MILQDPIDPNRIACFNLEGTGVGEWPVKTGHYEIEHPTNCLGIWDSKGDYYIAFVPAYLDIATLAQETFNGTRTKLPLHWAKKSLPNNDQATSLYGKARFYGEQTKVLAR